MHKQIASVIAMVVLASFFVNIASLKAEPSNNETADSTSAISGLPAIKLSSDIKPVVSIGQPSRNKFQWGIMSGYSWDDDHVNSRLFVNDHLLLAIPQLGGVRITAEAGLERGLNWLGGTGFVSGNLFGIQNGVGYSTHYEKIMYRLAIDIATRRGGLSGYGDRFRFEYIPTTKTIRVGVTVNSPFGRYRRNRPLLSHVPLTKVKLLRNPSIDTSLVSIETLRQIKHSLEWMDILLTPRLAYDIDSHRQVKKFRRNVAQIQDHLQNKGHNFRTEDSVYHQALRDVFVKAARERAEVGHALAEDAEDIILNEVVIPFNRLFGQKKRPFDLSQFSSAAIQAFEKQVSLRIEQSESNQRDAARIIFHEVVLKIEQIAGQSKKRWSDDRLVWLPLNFGLQADQYDTQQEVNKIIEAVVERKFIPANDITYLYNDQGYYELERMILETEYYHVIHIHDFRGKTDKRADKIGWRLITDGYIPAFINAIEAIDRGQRTRLPQFMVFLDQHYYEQNKSRGTMNFIENLYEPGNISFKDKKLEAKVLQAQRRLIDAIKHSKTFGELSKDVLKERIKVHINITNVFDPVYSDDAIARDHSKLAYRDIFEDDPSVGVALFTGMGVGELYVGSNWDDRSVLVRGPDLVHLKTATRELFIDQGYDSTEVPYFLRPRLFPDNYDRLCDELRSQGWTTSLVNVMNQTGFGKKWATVIKTLLYNLSLPGSTLVVPDSIWASDYWASMLAAVSLRGASVYVIAPAKAQAPSAATITMETVRKALKSMVRISEIFKDEIKQNGGILRVGFYRRESDVHDIGSRLTEFVSRQNDDPRLQQLFNVHPGVKAEMERIYTDLSAMNSGQYIHLIPDDTSSMPKLHAKAQFFLGPGSLSVLQKPEWATILTNYFEIRKRQVMHPGQRTAGLNPALTSQITSKMNPGDNSIFFMTIGSHNQDRRSALLDGEALVLVAGPEALTGIIDFALLMGSTDWIDDLSEIDKEFPRSSGIIRAIAKIIKNWI